MFETGMQQLRSEEHLSAADDVSTAGIVLFDALARFQAGETEGGLRCLQQLQRSRSLITLIDVLCPGLSARSDQQSRRILSLLPGETGNPDQARGADGNPEVSAQAECVPDLEDGVLTLRQRSVLKQVREGCSNTEIARRLAISKNTVKWHLKEIFRRLEVENRCSALKVARLRKLI